MNKLYDLGINERKNDNMHIFIKKAIVIFGMLLLCLSFLVQEFYYVLEYFIMEKASLAPIKASIITAITCAVLRCLSIMMIIVGLASLAHEKPLFESARKQVYRYFAYWGCLVTAIANLSWDFLYTVLPAKDSSSVPAVFSFEPLVDLSHYFSEITFPVLGILGIVFTVAFVFGICVNANIWLNRIGAVLWVIFAYEMLHNMILHAEYSALFWVFILVCYAIIGASVLTCRRNKSDVLIPKYEVILIDLEDTDDEEGEEGSIYDDTEHDFSIFMPKGVTPPKE